MDSSKIRVGGVILCGGKSKRMGLAKAKLPFGAETMLGRVVRLLGDVVQPLVVVAARGQTLPPLPENVILTYDARPDRGPLEGIAAGLSAIQGRVDAAFVTSCDVPLLNPAFVQRLIHFLGSSDIAVPIDAQLRHPLCAVYRVSVLEQIRCLLSENRLRPTFLFELVSTSQISTEHFRDIDPQLDTLKNLNRPEEYYTALQLAGFEIEPTIQIALEQAAATPNSP